MSAVSLQSESGSYETKRFLRRDQLQSAKLKSQPIAPIIREFVCETEEVWSENSRAEVAKEEAA